MPLPTAKVNVNGPIQTATNAIANGSLGMMPNLGDYSSMYRPLPYQSSSGDFGRHWLGQLIGFGGEADYDDWVRQEQSSQNSFARSLYQMSEQNKFNASEAQKQRDFEERMSNTAYQRAVADMKLAGINPALAYNQGGNSTPSGASASSSSVGSFGGNRAPRNNNTALGSIINLISGLITASSKLTGVGIMAATSRNNANTYAQARTKTYYDTSRRFDKNGDVILYQRQRYYE